MDPAERPPDDWREFFAGLSQPSLPSALGAVLVAALVWAVAATRITWASVAEGWWLSSPVDDYAALTAGCLNSRDAPRAALPVLLIGASASREALVEPRALSVQLSRATGLPPHAAVARGLFAGDLHPVEMLALTDCLPEGFDGLVVVSVSPQALSEPLEASLRLLRQPRLPLRSQAQRGWAAARGLSLKPASDVPLLDAPSFFLARPQALMNMRRRQPPMPEYHQIEHMPDPSPEAWEKVILPRMRAWTEGYEAHSAENFGIYAALVGALQAKGARVVLMDAPRNPTALAQALSEPAERAALQRYEADVVGFTEKVGAAWVQPMAGLGLDGEAFKDHSHIDTREAREAWTRALAEQLAGVLRASGWTPAQVPGPPPMRPGAPPTTGGRP